MRTPITYYGGKRRLAEGILQMMPGHRIYCKPFFGYKFLNLPGNFVVVGNIHDNPELI